MHPLTNAIEPATLAARPPRWRIPLLKCSRLGLVLFLPVCLLAFWEYAARFLLGSSVLLPPPSRVFVTIGEMFRDGTLQGDVIASVERVFIGYALSVVVAVPIGLAMGWSRIVDDALGATVHGLRSIPVTAWVPISIVLVGIGDRPAIFLVFIGTVWPLILNTSHGVRTVPKHLIWAAQTMGASKPQLFLKVIIPGALPAVFTGMRIAMGVAWTAVIVSELIAVRSGLGYMITEARLIVRYDMVLAGMVAIGVIGFLLDVAVHLSMAWVLRWQKGLTV
jgi:NitT/TauT family transport system permease protein